VIPTGDIWRCHAACQRRLEAARDPDLLLPHHLLPVQCWHEPLPAPPLLEPLCGEWNLEALCDEELLSTKKLLLRLLWWLNAGIDLVGWLAARRKLAPLPFLSKGAVGSKGAICGSGPCKWQRDRLCQLSRHHVQHSCPVLLSSASSNAFGASRAQVDGCVGLHGRSNC
jgi:hypothetical protein